MDFCVLGPLEIWTVQGRLALPSTRHQRVLATLLLAPGMVVPMARLIESTWDEEPPATATKQVQNCVSALRDRLGDTEQQLIVTDGPGYRLVVTDEQLDLLRFTKHVAEARRQVDKGALRDGVREIRTALKLWRGPALDGLGTGALAGRAARLDEQRLDAFESCVDWQLALGQHREVIDELAAVVADNPLRERPHAQLMLALDRAGRQADALKTFQQLRAGLAEELGVDPGADVCELHERILRGENRPRRAKPAPTDGLDRAAKELAAAIARQWTAEAEMRSLHRPKPVPLRWSSTEREVAAAASAVLGDSPGYGSERLVLSGDLTDVVAKFRQVPSRQLVVLGEPGAGKSVLAVLLTLGLLADLPPGEPVPVLLTLASWNPHHEHLDAWLARRLVEDYPWLANTAIYGPDAGLRLVLDGRVIPVLDGLDETPPGLHTAAIDALDQAVSAGRPLVVTCRGTEYELAVRAAGSFLVRAAVVEIEPVEIEDAVEFLTARRRPGETRWQPLVTWLKREPTGALAQALRTPLMVDLARSAYASPATDPGELCDTARFPDRATIERHLLDAYLPSVYARRPSPPARLGLPREYDPKHVERWLSFLARRLERERTRDLAWWRLDQAVPRFVVGLYLGLPPALLFVLTGLLAADPVTAAIYGVSGGAAGLVTHSIGRRPGPQRVEATFTGISGRFARRFAIGAATGTCLGFGWALPIGVIGLVVVVVGLAVGVHVWLGTPLDANRVSNPGTVLRQDRAAALSFTLAFTMSLGLFYSLALRFTQDEPTVQILDSSFDLVLSVAGGVAAALLGRYFAPKPGTVAYGIAGALIGGRVIREIPSVVHAVAAGGLFGLAVGLSVCLSRAWGAFACTRLWLAARGHIPLRFMAFLDDAHRRGVLRQVGAVYQFRHARLQERLAATGFRDDG
ncbi:BTAD domain-containing putative transcriptional regulator [Amycolatopsis benzoatilytica]|uniref:BTAD domain-containing putative transcriptional regulator n=1 Tax=Amycolatopsis benzoatilytica TaxID=346045 RepID=UPI000369845E|nr:BTAD domain-containing putative transcriptional regulator [Amycolatopsis benzoatilytica]